MCLGEVCIKWDEVAQVPVGQLDCADVWKKEGNEEENRKQVETVTLVFLSLLKRWILFRKADSIRTI